jgi:hypothetical protein
MPKNACPAEEMIVGSWSSHGACYSTTILLPVRRHGWGAYGLWKKRYMGVGDRHSHAVWRRLHAIRKCDRRSEGADVVHGSTRKEPSLSLACRRVPLRYERWRNARPVAASARTV